MRDTKEAFDFLLEDDHEVIIYGVLKRLGVRRNESRYDDLVQEGRLAFISAYERYQGEMSDQKSLLNFIYQGVYWDILDHLRKSTRESTHIENGIEDDLDIVLVSKEDENKVEVRVILDGILEYVNENERELITRLYYRGQNMTQIAEEMGVSRKTLYQWRKRIIKKAKIVLGNRVEMI